MSEFLVRYHQVEKVTTAVTVKVSGFESAEEAKAALLEDLDGHNWPIDTSEVEREPLSIKNVEIEESISP